MTATRSAASRSLPLLIPFTHSPHSSAVRVLRAFKRRSGSKSGQGLDMIRTSAPKSAPPCVNFWSWNATAKLVSAPEAIGAPNF
jgi:hypothetical protein